MKKFEVLSPAGDMDSFKIAIKSGADAVYLGLSKFNARMKADNIGLDNIREVVEYAHLRDVRVYVTINTLILRNEMQELIDMVGVCLECGVDAFIVQDYGVIFMLKSIYPNIVLHGSTQLGVHNVRGAKVAKEMGLSRVVLSREVTVADIRDIAENVDIELEVFVQGAMCVCFSGNCYFSSLKHNASGNRGLCKQLCRLPYEMKTKSKNLNGYLLSPSDNCMVDYMRELCDIGVISFKIEGRLRRSGYVGVATRVYREILDDIVCGEVFDNVNLKKQLAKVFSRGQFVSGYFETNDIIDINHNSHMGEKIGKVLKCVKFKDIYQFVLNCCVELHAGDGLKLVNGKHTVTMGVGNVEKQGANQIVYSKSFASVGADVYRVLDSEFEANMVDNMRRRVVDFEVVLNLGESIYIKATCGDISVEKQGALVQEAKSKPLTEDNVRQQISKTGDEVFVVGNMNISMSDNLFLPISEINSVRREIIEELKCKILESMKLPYKRCLSTEIIDTKNTLTYNSIAIVNEKCNINKLVQKYDALILSPNVYSLAIVKQFYNEYKKYFDSQMIINLPIIMMIEDKKIIDEIVSFAIENNIILLANNIYALDYINEGATIWAGSNMNVVSEYSKFALEKMGVKEVVSSIEKWNSNIPNTYKMCNGKRVLMTMVHCPYKTINGSGCGYDDSNKSKCSYSNEMSLGAEGGEYKVRRFVVGKCYFELIDDYIETKNSIHAIDDIREV